MGETAALGLRDKPPGLILGELPSGRVSDGGSLESEGTEGQNPLSPGSEMDNPVGTLSLRGHRNLRGLRCSVHLSDELGAESEGKTEGKGNEAVGANYEETGSSHT